jgi:glutaredoxin 3
MEGLGFDLTIPGECEREPGLENGEPMPKITVYTAGHCCYCHMAKELLRRKGAPFDEVDLTGRTDLREELRVKSGRQTVPQIWIGETHVGGCDDLLSLERAGKLDAMLAT